MDKETIIDYVMNTPHNANRQVLEGMLNVEGGSGGSEPLIVTFNYGEGEGEYTASVPLAQVQQAFGDGRLVIFEDQIEGGSNRVIANSIGLQYQATTVSIQNDEQNNWGFISNIVYGIDIMGDGEFIDYTAYSFDLRSRLIP